MIRFPGIRPKPFANISEDFDNERYPSTLLGLLDHMSRDNPQFESKPNPDEKKGASPSPSFQARLDRGTKISAHPSSQIKVNPKQHKSNASETGRKQGIRSPHRAASSSKNNCVEGDKISQDDIMKHVDLMLREKSDSSRITSVFYGGSEELTFPYSSPSQQHDVFEGHKKGQNIQDLTWDQHSQLRSAGVLAMRELIARCSRSKKQCLELELSLDRCQNQIKQHEKKIEELLGEDAQKDNLLKGYKSEVTRLTALVDSEKELRHIKIDRMSATIQNMKARIDALLDEKEHLLQATTAVESESKRHNEIVMALKRELDEKSNTIRDDAAKLAKLVHEIANITFERNNQERELQLLNEDFEYAKIKLKSCQQYTEQMERKHNLKVRNCFGEIEKLQGMLEAEAAARKQAEDQKDELSAAALKSNERLLYLEQELVKVQAASDQRTANYDGLVLELQACRRRIRWAWLLQLVLFDKAFPSSDVAAVQTNASVTADVGTLVDLPVQVRSYFE